MHVTMPHSIITVVMMLRCSLQNVKNPSTLGSVALRGPDHHQDIWFGGGDGTGDSDNGVGEVGGDEDEAKDADVPESASRRRRRETATVGCTTIAIISL